MAVNNNKKNNVIILYLNALAAQYCMNRQAEFILSLESL
jgi:hypothetical protein